MAKASPVPGTEETPSETTGSKVDEQLNKAVTDQTRDWKTWAVYRLGIRAGTLPANAELYRTNFFALGSKNGSAIHKSIRDVRETCQLLDGILSKPNVPRITELTDGLAESKRESEVIDPDSDDFIQYVKDIVSQSCQLSDLIQTSIPLNSLSRPWFDFGFAFGAFLGNENLGPCDFCSPISPIIDAARNLPERERNAIEEIKKLASLIDQPDTSDETGLRRAYVADLAKNWPVYASKTDCCSGDAIYPFYSEISQLSRIIDNYLYNRFKAVPQWNSARGELWFRGKLIRTYASQAHDVGKILDLFEELEWPPSVDIKSLKLDGEAKGYVRSLNERISVIRFSSCSRKNVAELVEWSEDKTG